MAFALPHDHIPECTAQPKRLVFKVVYLHAQFSRSWRTVVKMLPALPIIKAQII